jgi:predicted permease
MLLRVGLGAAEREFIAGDMDEEYATVIVAARGVGGARRWYWRQAVGTVLERRSARFRHGVSMLAGPVASLGPMVSAFGVGPIRTTGRTLLRSPAFSAWVVLLLALGIGATTAVWSVVHGVLLRPLPYAAPERLVQVFETEVAASTGDVETRGYFAWQNFADVREEAVAFEALAAWQYYDRTLTGVAEAVRLAGRMVTADFFEVFGVRPELGRALAADEFEDGAQHVAILSHGVWRTAFGADPSLIGREVMLDGTPHVIVGVMPAGFAFPLDAELWMPLVPYLGPGGEGARRSHRYRVAGRLASGISLTAARAQLATIAARLEAEHPETNTNNGFAAEPLRDVLVGNARPALQALFGAVALLLVIACANVGGLFVVRAAARDGEMAIRTALGASRAHVAGQLLVEGMLLAGAGGVLGILLARWAIDGFKTMVGNALPRADAVLLDGSAVAAGLAASMVTGILFGMAPILRNTRTGSRLVHPGRRSSAGREVVRLRRALAMAQLALACVLVVGAVLLVRTFASLSAIETGVDVEDLVALDVSLPEARYPDAVSRHGFFRTVVEQVRARPGIQGAAAGLAAPLAGFPWGNGLRIEGRPVAENEIPTVSYNVVTDDYFEVAGIRLVAGRTLNETDGLEAVVVNTVVAGRFWPGEDAVGRRVRFRDDVAWSAIVGVVDAVPAAAGEPASASVYVPLAFEALATMTLIVRSGADPGAAIAIVREVVQALDGEVPITNVATIRDLMAETLARPRYTAAIVALFGAAALLLACAGIYGVLAYAVAQRSKELGIRLAVGARPTDLFRLVLSEGAVVVGAGLGAGLVGALLAARLMAGLLYGVSPSDGATFGVVALAVALVGFVASVGPALRAGRTDPIQSLRAD